MRTTVLVCLAASVAMIQVNLLLPRNCSSWETARPWNAGWVHRNNWPECALSLGEGKLAPALSWSALCVAPPTQRGQAGLLVAFW